jgi:hypothetical protein
MRPGHTGKMAQKRGRRKHRVPVAPVAACAVVESTRVSHHRFTGTPGISCATVLTAYFALSPGTGLVCPRRLAEASAKLDASVGASGPHDFAVREISAFVNAPPHVHRIPYPTSVTIAKRPSVWAGMVRDVQVICLGSELKYFCERGWTCDAVICPSGQVNRADPVNSAIPDHTALKANRRCLRGRAHRMRSPK